MLPRIPGRYAHWINSAILNALLDKLIGSARGTLAMRGASGWQALLPGSTAGQVLKTNGTGADLSYSAGGSGDVVAANNGTEFTAATFATNLAIVRVVKKQVFTASGTYTPSTGMLFADIWCLGPGGGGGGCANSGAGSSNQGGGGGAGSLACTRVTAAAIGASKAVTIGSGGAGGATGANNGSAGSSDTSVGTLCVGKAGSGGGAGGPAGAGGAGGAAGTGDVAGVGEAGDMGVPSPNTATTYGLTGKGGSTMFGGGAAMLALNGNANGTAATGYGAGGGGGTSWNTGGTAAGGNGSGGLCSIIEYCTQ